MLNTLLSYYAQYFLHQKAVTKSALTFAVVQHFECPIFLLPLMKV